MHGDRGHGCAGAGSRSTDPVRRRAGEEHGREHEDPDEPGNDERDATDDRAHRSRDPPGAEDRQLRGGGTRQQVAGSDRVLELLRREPPLAIDAELAEQRDVRRRATEADAPDASPLPQHCVQGRMRGRTSRPAFGGHAVNPFAYGAAG